MSSNLVEHYISSNIATVQSFKRDLKIVTTIKKCFTKFSNNQDCLLLLMNKLTVYFNLFGNEDSIYYLFNKLTDDHKPIMKALMISLEYIEENDTIFANTHEYQEYMEVIINNSDFIKHSSTWKKS